MKLFRFLALAALLVTTLATGAFAQSTVTGDDPPFGDSGSDSTSVTLVSAGADTTAWVDLLYKKFPIAPFAGYPLLKAAVNTNAAAGDTMTITLQYSQDKTNIFSGSAQNLIGASPQSAVLITADTHTNSPQFGFRYVRAIVADADVSRTAAFTNVSVDFMYLSVP